MLLLCFRGLDLLLVMSGALERRFLIDATVVSYSSGLRLSTIQSEFPGINRDLILDLVSKMPEDLPPESITSKKLRREVWRALEEIVLKNLRRCIRTMREDLRLKRYSFVYQPDQLEHAKENVEFLRERLTKI